MTCPYLEYRESDGDHSFDHERPYCGIQESFVSPMAADLCNDRHGFDHESDCSVFQRHHLDADQLVPGLELQDAD